MRFTGEPCGSIAGIRDVARNICRRKCSHSSARRSRLAVNLASSEATVKAGKLILVQLHAARSRAETFVDMSAALDAADLCCYRTTNHSITSISITNCEKIFNFESKGGNPKERNILYVRIALKKHEFF